MQQLVATTLARHESISVIDFRCTTRVESMHSEASLSYVRSGSLRYRARGKTFENGLPADYAVGYFDLDKVAVQPNKLVTDKTRFPAAAIVADGDWRKLTVDMKTRDGWLYLVIGATAKGAHVFAGSPDRNTSGIAPSDLFSRSNTPIAFP